MKHFLTIVILAGTQISQAQGPFLQESMKSAVFDLGKFKANSHSVSNQRIQFTSVKTALISSGSEGVGGGHVVSCQGQSSVTLDYYNALIVAKNKSRLLDPEDNSFDNTIIERLNGFQSERDSFEPFNNLNVGEWLSQKLFSLGKVSEWTDVNLKIVIDHKLIYNLPPTCVLEQAAAQENRGNDIEMYQNSNVTNKISAGQKKILRIHEALYSLVRRHLGISSQPVRALLEKLLLKDLSDTERDRAINNFITDMKATSRKHVCLATGYQELFNGYHKFYRENTKSLAFYGKTDEEAFEKLQNAQSTTGYIPCNEVGNGGNAITGECLRPIALGENCK